MRIWLAQVKLSELHLEPNTAPVDIYMPLTSSSLSTARLHLALQLLQRSAVPVRPGPPAVATVGGVANQTQRSALIPGDTSVTWQSPKPPAPPPGADDRCLPPPAVPSPFGPFHSSFPECLIAPNPRPSSVCDLSWPCSARVRDLTKRLEAEKSSRLAAEKQFDALTKESARLRVSACDALAPCTPSARPH